MHLLQMANKSLWRFSASFNKQRMVAGRDGHVPENCRQTFSRKTAPGKVGHMNEFSSRSKGVSRERFDFLCKQFLPWLHTPIESQSESDIMHSGRVLCSKKGFHHCSTSPHMFTLAVFPQTNLITSHLIIIIPHHTSSSAHSYPFPLALSPLLSPLL